jgi:hypothetical protein
VGFLWCVAKYHLPLNPTLSTVYYECLLLCQCLHYYFPAAKFAQLNPKKQKESKAKPAKEEKKKETPKKEKKEKDDEDVPKPPKEKDPFADLPKT